MPRKFVLNDETVKNSYGFYVLNSGGKFARFDENPVLLHEHDPRNVVGNWTGRNLEGTTLTATPQFDEEDEAAVKLKGKVERKYLRGASIGILINKMEKVEINGKKELAATDWELMEASVVSVPSNAASLVIFNSEGKLLAASDVPAYLSAIIPADTNTNTNSEHDMSKVIVLSAAALALLAVPADKVTDDLVSQKLVDLAAERDAHKTALESISKAKAEALVTAALAAGKIKAEQKDQFLKLAGTDYSLAESTLAMIPEKKSLSQQVQQPKAAEAGDDKDSWDFKTWQRKDSKGLSAMRTTDPERYEALRQAANQ